MGFLDALWQMGSLEEGEDEISSYLKFPLEQEGRAIRVFLEVSDPFAEQLDVQGVNKLDLADIDFSSEYKRKYLYRERVGANVYWGYSPLHRLSAIKKTKQAKYNLFFGKQGNWVQDKDAHLNKIKVRTLNDYEKEGVFTPGSVEKIMEDLSSEIDKILEDLEPGVPHIVLFGVKYNDTFLYPGDIPVFVNYFQKKLKENLGEQNSGTARTCAICRETSELTSTLDKAFKFATFDKVSPLPGLSKDEAGNVFPVCMDCLGSITAGREKVERTLSNSRVITGINIWVVPEGAPTSTVYMNTVRTLEERIQNDRAVDEKTEDIFFRRLAREGTGLVFHFLFVERSQSQEIVHLLVEDVPPERLILLEDWWQETFKDVLGEGVEKGVYLDWALRSLHVLLYRIAGKSNSDQAFLRDFALKVLSKLLQGKPLPVQTLKKFITSRIPRLVHESSGWNNVQWVMLYSQIWVDFMTKVNEEV